MDARWGGRGVVTRAGRQDGDTGRTGTPTGGYVTRVLAPASAVFHVPDGLGLREAAPMLTDGLTAVFLAEQACVRPGESVLVTPAGGGLGNLLVQLAHAAGARAGADAAVDYPRDGWPDRVREATGGSGPDVVLDGVGGPPGRASFELAVRGARFFGHGAPSGAFTEIDPREAQRRGVAVATPVALLGRHVTPTEERRLTETALAEAAGRIRSAIGQTFPLERAADAHTAMEARQTLGKSLLLT